MLVLKMSNFIIHNLYVTSILLFFVLPLVLTQSESCTNPNRKTGRCSSVYDCPALIEVLERNQQGFALSTSQRDFIRASQCPKGVGRAPFVCCTSDNDYANNQNPITAPTTSRTASPSNGRGNVLPTPPQCGPLSLQDKIYNGQATGLSDYPWMAILEYTDKNGELDFKCAGSLINQRYVLTAAHCLIGKIEKAVGPLTIVRLGEYDTTSEIDCIAQNCNDKTVRVGVEQIIPHPEYMDSNNNRHHDIGLIRLDTDVDFTYFIQPVCLPLPNYRQSINVGEFLTVAGWGRTLTARTSNVKQHLAIPVADHDACTAKFSTRKINLIESQLCAGGEFAKDSCDGDSGGPFMRQGAQRRWFLEGIVSFGNRCGLEDWPAIYTRVSDYTDWIERTLRP